MSRYFGSGNRGVRKRTAVMRLSDLSEPISLVRGKRTPDDSVNWVFSVTPYLETWAAVDEGPTASLGGENSDASSRHLFMIRQEPMAQIGINDFVVWQGAYYQVVSVQPVKGTIDYLELSTRYHSSVDKANAVRDDDGDKPADGSMPSPQPSFWS